MSENDACSTKTNTNAKQTFDNLLNKPVISIKEARKLLGADYNDKSDTQISEIICSMRAIANALLEMATSSTERNGGIIEEGDTTQ